jgi:hypothetical protein
MGANQFPFCTKVNKLIEDDITKLKSIFDKYLPRFKSSYSDWLTWSDDTTNNCGENDIQIFFSQETTGISFRLFMRRDFEFMIDCMLELHHEFGLEYTGWSDKDSDFISLTDYTKEGILEFIKPNWLYRKNIEYLNL